MRTGQGGNEPDDTTENAPLTTSPQTESEGEQRLVPVTSVLDFPDDDTIATLPLRESAEALTIVGIGGSAGSIPALEAFFQNVPASAEDGSAYVVVLHLSPDFESRLAELLSRST